MLTMCINVGIVGNIKMSTFGKNSVICSVLENVRTAAIEGKTLLQQSRSLEGEVAMPEKIAIETENAPGAIGPYSQAVKIDKIIFTSGALPIDPSTGKIAEGSIAERTHQVIKNLTAALEAAGATLDDVLKTTIFLADMVDFQEVNQIYSMYFKSPYPARSTVQVARLPLDSDIEIEAVACLK